MRASGTHGIAARHVTNSVRLAGLIGQQLSRLQGGHAKDTARGIGQPCRCFPGAWQVHFVWPNGKGALLTGIEKERPSYERLLSALQGVPGSKASRSWVDRVNPFSGVRSPCRPSV